MRPVIETSSVAIVGAAFLDLLDGLSSWKSAVGAVVAAMMGLFTAAIGDPSAPEGKALALVGILLLADLAMGSASALVSGTFRWERFRMGLGKLLLWGTILAVVRQLARPIGIAWADPVLLFVSNWILVSLIVIDLVSFLKHSVAIAFFCKVDMKGMDRLIAWIERWHEKIVIPQGAKAPQRRGGRARKPPEEPPDPGGIGGASPGD